MTVRTSSLVAGIRETAEADPGRCAFTFFDYSTDRAGRARPMTYGELDLRARAMARALRGTADPGARAAILCPQTADYLVSFLGCLYAGLIAVPLFAPEAFRSTERLVLAMADCRPDVVITTEPFRQEVDELLLRPELRPGTPKEVLFADRVDTTEARHRHPVPVAEDATAYLQYTSGSTRSPAGVEVTYRNMAAGTAQLAAGFGVDEEARLVSWLPFFHDMGLVFTLLLPLTLRVPVDFLTPFAFVQQPRRWLNLLSDRRATHTVSPNFGLDLCVDRVSEERRAGLDLSALKTLVNGSEPIRVATLERFSAAYAPYGFAPVAHSPGYGLAEATLVVTATPPGRAPAVLTLDRA
ncbi:AMP-binding protein, partial [Streptomyces sp. W16]|uniref:AMP-binding protein n=1 Tax=Streptomyces sp. W16 TaxID=3076631 RepID=UPI00295AED88